METAEMLKSLQDPLGVPFYPVVYQILMVLVFALHITFVNFSIGSIGLAVYGHFKADQKWKRLSLSMARVVSPSVSFAFVTAVAPLLFLQTLYDPFWYSSSILSAWWSLGFIVALMIAYSFSYIFNFGRVKTGGKGYAFYGVVALLLFLLAGVIIHALNVQLLQPDRWADWYASGSSVDTTGGSLHSFQISRFLHFIVPAFAMIGIFLMLYSWYFKDRDDMDRAHLDWVGQLGAKMAFNFTLLQVVIGVWWILVIPGEFKFYFNHFFILGVLLTLWLLHTLYRARRNPAGSAVKSLVVAFVTILVMAYSREMLRMDYLGKFDYNLFDYPVKFSWSGTILFLSTFVMGVVVLGYLSRVVFLSGRKSGEVSYSASIARWGKVSLGLIVAWIVVVAVLGIVMATT